VRRRGSHVLKAIGSEMAVRLSALLAGRLLAPRKIPGTQRLSRPQGHIAAGTIKSIKRSHHLMGNRTRYLQSCSIVPPHNMTVVA
jgi:hypothetical protein